MSQRARGEDTLQASFRSNVHKEDPAGVSGGCKPETPTGEQAKASPEGDCVRRSDARDYQGRSRPAAKMRLGEVMQAHHT